MAALKFYFQYDKDTHKGKVVLADKNGTTSEHLVDRILCQVPVCSIRSETSPRFVVQGYCCDYMLDRSTGELVIVLL